MVPGSTFRYGSSFRSSTLKPRACSSAPSAAAAIPLPRDETTPPVTNTYRVMGAHHTEPNRAWGSPSVRIHTFGSNQLVGADGPAGFGGGGGVVAWVAGAGVSRIERVVPPEPRFNSARV